jgi:hypothetical protein
MVVLYCTVVAKEKELVFEGDNMLAGSCRVGQEGGAIVVKERELAVEEGDIVAGQAERDERGQCCGCKGETVSYRGRQYGCGIAVE